MTAGLETRDHYGRPVIAYLYAPGWYVWRDPHPACHDWQWVVGVLVTPPAPETVEYEEIELASDGWTIQARHKRTHTPPTRAPYVDAEVWCSVNSLPPAAQTVALAVLKQVTP